MIEQYKITGPQVYVAAKKKYSQETKKWYEEGKSYMAIKTPSGTYPSEKWDELMLAAVQADGLTDLLQGIKEHVKTHCLWLKEKEIEHYALECLSHKSYEAWSDFSYQQSLF